MIRFGMDWSFKRGMQSEDNVEQALQKLKQQKKIQNYQRAERNSKLDRKGIDFVATKADGKDVFIQVKSSPTAVDKWNKKRGRPKAINGQDEGLVKKLSNLLFGRMVEHFHGLTNFVTMV